MKNNYADDNGGHNDSTPADLLRGLRRAITLANTIWMWCVCVCVCPAHEDSLLPVLLLTRKALRIGHRGQCLCCSAG